MTLFRLNTSQNAQIGKGTWENLKTEKVHVTISKMKFYGVLFDEIWHKFKLIWNKNLVSKRIYRKKKNKKRKAIPTV